MDNKQPAEQVREQKVEMESAREMLVEADSSLFQGYGGHCMHLGPGRLSQVNDRPYPCLVMTTSYPLKDGVELDDYLEIRKCVGEVTKLNHRKSFHLGLQTPRLQFLLQASVSSFVVCSKSSQK